MGEGDRAGGGEARPQAGSALKTKLSALSYPARGGATTLLHEVLFVSAGGAKTDHCPLPVAPKLHLTRTKSTYLLPV
jgi:hypothetical protein